MRAARSDEGVRVERALYLLDSGELSVGEMMRAVPAVRSV